MKAYFEVAGVAILAALLIVGAWMLTAAIIGLMIKIGKPVFCFVSGVCS